MTEYFADDPAPPEQRITELYAWIAVQGNDGEGIIGAVLDGQYLPLVSAKRELMVRMKALADEVIAAGKGSRTNPVGARLVTFRRVEE
jgi:hypothetical protein